jgi:hypothetical protein
MTLEPETVAKILAICTGFGVVLPHLQAILQTPRLPSRAKAILTVILSIVGGVAAYVVGYGLFDWHDPVAIIGWVVGVYLMTSTLYARLLRPIGSTGYLENAVHAGHAPISPEPADVDPGGPQS